MKPKILPIYQPLDLASTLNSGQSFRWFMQPDESWTGVIGSDLVRLRNVGEHIEFESTSRSPIQMADYLLHYFRMDDSLPDIQRRLGQDEYLGNAIRSFPGLRLLRQLPWETLIGFILSSTSNIPRISRTVESIARRFGEPVRMGEICRHTFPTPSVLSAVGEQDLRDLGCGFRAPYLIQAAQAVDDGSLNLEVLRSDSYESSLAALKRLVGVGDKIADCVMLFSLDKLEAFPVDRWIFRVLTERYQVPAKFDYAHARDWASEKFGRDAGYANHYMFLSRRSELVIKPSASPRLS